MRSHLLSLAAISLTAFAVIPLSPAMAGDLYKWTDDKGQIHYSSVPPATNPGKVKAVDPGSLPRLNTLPSNPSAVSAEDESAKTSSRSGTSKPAATPSVADNSPPAEPASPPALIPAELLPPSNPPATAKPEQPAQSDLVEVVAQGMGIDANAALLNAYSNAVQQALGLYVDAETMVQNDQIVRDKILTYSKGFIQEAKEISNNQANGLFQVNIRAKVRRQQLLEQAKANNISVKAVEGASLHAQVESQLKQEKDAKALLEKALLPLMDTTFHRADLAPSTQEQPNPTINKAGTDDNFVTLDYKVYLRINEPEYVKYVKHSLIPVLNQIAIHKGEFTANYQPHGEGSPLDPAPELNITGHSYDKDFLFNVLTWRDPGLTTSKWQRFVISIDQIPQEFLQYQTYHQACKKAIELSLLDKESEIVALGNLKLQGSNDCYTAIWWASSYKTTIISPDFSNTFLSQSPSFFPFISRLVSVKISKADLPRVKSAKLEVKPAEGK